MRPGAGKTQNEGNGYLGARPQSVASRRYNDQAPMPVEAFPGTEAMITPSHCPLFPAREISPRERQICTPRRGSHSRHPEGRWRPRIIRRAHWMMPLSRPPRL